MPRLGGEITKIQWDQTEIERIKTVKADMGCKGTPDLIRILLTEKYKQVTGSPIPNGKTKR